MSLAGLREIARDQCRNNPLAKGLLKTERDGVVGTGPKMQARTSDEKFNIDAEQAFKETMIDVPCDTTGRFNFNKLIRTGYLSYRRDGDMAFIFTDSGIQPVEGDQIGTPAGKKLAKNFDVINGVAYTKKTGRVLGYYIGKPNKWGYIQQGNWKNYKAENVHHVFNPDRFSSSRGEPALTQASKYLDYLMDYYDAELVAAKVNACFSVFIAQKDSDVPDAYTGGISSTGTDTDGNRLEKVEPGTIMYGKPGEGAQGLGQVRPGGVFDTFVLRTLMVIGRSMCMPLMLVTLDYSGATFMNARLAYQKAQEAWSAEQGEVVKLLAARIWRWKIASLIASGELKGAPVNWYRHEVICNRWPYVDPFKESKADEQQLKNGTTTRTAICARQGTDFEEVAQKLADEKKTIEEIGLNDVTE